MLADYEFNNYLTTENLPEVIQRVKNIIGDSDVRFSISACSAGADVPDLTTRVRVEDADYLSQDATSFAVIASDNVRFGASTDHSTVSAAMRAHDRGQAYTFITVTGGNGLPGLLKQGIVIRGSNQYGVSYCTVIKVEDSKSSERTEAEATLLEKVAYRIQSLGAEESIVQGLLEDASQVRYTQESVLG